MRIGPHCCFRAPSLRQAGLAFCPMQCPALLTPPEHALFERRETLRYGSHGTPWRDHVIEIDWEPLVELAAAAHRSDRIYELMALSRPGDLLRYARVHLVDVGPRTLAAIQSRRRTRLKYDPVQNGDCMPFVDFEWSYWSSEDAWQHWGSDPDTHSWNVLRAQPLWRELLGTRHRVVRLVQERVRGRHDDFLLQHELGLMDRGEHRRDFWSKREQLPRWPRRVEPSQTPVPEGLQEVLCALARHPEIRSMSLPFTDWALWRALVEVQVRRSLSEGCSPNEALHLGGAEADAWAQEAADWGGEVKGPHSPEMFDVFVLPLWHGWFRDRAVAAGSARVGSYVSGPGKCKKVLIAHCDLGEFETEDRIACEGWFIYRAKDFRW